MTKKQPPLRSLSWPGSKECFGPLKHGRWIASLLPYRRLYAEPFAGMLGILRAREPSRMEMMNDLDGNLVNWWRVIRDNHEELEDLLNLTPRWSADLWKEAFNKLKTETDPVRRAYWWTLVINWSYGAKGATLYRSYKATRPLIAPRIAPLYERIKHINIDRIDATLFLERTAKFKDSVVYVDPPYSNVAQKGNLYENNNYNRKELTEVLLKQTGFCAISGYSQEWDHLDWYRHEFKTRALLDDSKGQPRVEVLWTNEPTIKDTSG